MSVLNWQHSPATYYVCKVLYKIRLKITLTFLCLLPVSQNHESKCEVKLTTLPIFGTHSLPKWLPFRSSKLSLILMTVPMLLKIKKPNNTSNGSQGDGIEFKFWSITPKLCAYIRLQAQIPSSFVYGIFCLFESIHHLSKFDVNTKRIVTHPLVCSALLFSWLSMWNWWHSPSRERSLIGSSAKRIGVRKEKRKWPK